jgi:hypothetical protein
MRNHPAARLFLISLFLLGASVLDLAVLDLLAGG